MTLFDQEDYGRDGNDQPNAWLVDEEGGSYNGGDPLGWVAGTEKLFKGQ